MTTSPSPPLHFRITGGRVVLLDMAQNRYLALRARQAAHFRRVARGHAIGTIARSALQAIARAEMTGQAPELGPALTFCTSPSPPTGDRATAIAQAEASTALVIFALLAGIVARVLVRVLPLRVLVSPIAIDRLSCSRDVDFALVDRIAAACQRTALLLKSDGNCLARTLAFCWLCQRFGQYPPFIIGVQANPFSAHCWSQAGSMVLNDSYGYVRPYQPILVQ